MKKNTKIYKKAIPFIVAGGLTFGTCSCLGYTPFYTDKNIEHSNYMKEVFPDGDIQITYIEGKNEQNNFIKNYSKWEEVENGNYERTVDYYFFNDYDVEKLNAVKDNLDDLTPSVETIEKTSSIPEKNEAYTTVVVFDSKDKVVKESTLTNTLSTSAEIAAFLLLSFGIGEISRRKVHVK